ncbi:MAG TPA: hypothetical protein VGM05_12485 [Planctomycetaceae bacterium]|jgi:outer membrane lipoprotein-sorting protein
MQRFFSAVFAALVACGITGAARAEDPAVSAILDKAIKALGGEAKLSKLEAYSIKSKGTVTFGGNENTIVSESTIAGLDRFRQEFEVGSQGNQFQGLFVLNGDKAWRKNAGNDTMELDAEAIVNEKRSVYLQVIPSTILPHKTKAFKVETAGDETVAGHPAAVLKVTGPEGKTFSLAFDKQSGLPVKLEAKVFGFQGAEVTQETTYSDFTDFKGIKRPTKIESKRNGQPFGNVEVIEFKAIEKVDPKKFEKPE